MGFHKASYQLFKTLFYHLVCEVKGNSCYRCGLPILTVRELSIDHKEAWQASQNPKETFFDLNNIAYSHLVCNVKAGRKPTKIYANKQEQEKVYTKVRSARRKQNYDPAKRRAFYLRTGY